MKLPVRKRKWLLYRFIEQKEKENDEISRANKRK